MSAPHIARAVVADTLGPRCLGDVLEGHAQRAPDAVAVAAPGRAPLTYAGLDRAVRAAVASLNALGFGRAHRIGLALANGPEMAVAFIAVAAGAQAAPLDPAAGGTETEQALRGLRADALLLQSGVDSAARSAAQALGLPVIEVTPGEQAGIFTLTGPAGGARTAHEGLGEAEDVALLLRTSGSTSQRKLVPLTHRNICRVAHDNAVALRLTPADRCLGVMPLFHVHGLLAVTLASLVAGASVIYTPGFQVSAFLRWLETFHPSWYSAVPTMHQAVLTGASARREVASRSGLRMIRSGSAHLPRAVKGGLEDLFGVPVRESYGMTEVSPITYTPDVSKPGSVGLPVGTDIGIMDAAGRFLAPGARGEVVVRGPALMRGYADDPAANAIAFTDGWFRTGDRGYLDRDGFLFLSGRAKEIINRGGEKVQPAEVDAVLLEHSAVAEALTFAIPHPSLGEDVAAAVVLRGGAAATERDLRAFVAQRLALFKVPQTIVVVPEIPRDAVGKPSRRGLARRLGVSGPRLEPGAVRPPTELEQALTAIWTELLGVQGISLHDNFFALGGDSLRGSQLLARVRDLTGAAVSLSAFLQSPTVADLAAVIGTGPEIMARVLAQIEELSEEDAERLLARHMRPGHADADHAGSEDPGTRP